ncbi:MAG TPA: extracellular solute-binding protein [Chthoniobacterales bacterium]
MKLSLLIALLISIVAVPFILRPKQSFTAAPDHTLVVVTPHNEAIRYEFGRAFREYMRATHNADVTIDWRTPGGTSEIARYIDSEYLAAFEYFWTAKLHKKWSLEVKGAFSDSKIKLPADPRQDTTAQAARRTFLTSNISSGIDVFFGGGSFDFSVQANKGTLVDSGILKRHPEWFSAHGIPATRGGEPFYDKDGRWIGTCLASFGIVYNTDSLQLLGITKPPENWADLGDPAYLRAIALADPTKSGSILKAFEMLIQQQMHTIIEPGAATGESISRGWEKGLQLIQKISANAKYFTDSAPKVPIDVSSGDAAAGMCIDFFGRFQSESVARPDGTSRVVYLSPLNGTSYGVDPIGIFRGAPHRELAQEFIDFVLSDAGQRLWNSKIGAPGGPTKYQLRRLPVRPEFYGPENRAFVTDPDVFPYSPEALFDYQGAWTGPLFKPIGFIVRVMCIDPHEELASAWTALSVAKFPPQATAKFLDVSAVNYAYAAGDLKKTLNSPNKIDEVRLAKNLSEHFRAQYREAQRLARAGM